MMSITTQDHPIRQEQIEKLELALANVKNNQSSNDFKEQLRREIYINALESQLEETREEIENIHKTYNDRLQGNRLEWIDKVPETGDRSIAVRVTVLDEEPDGESKTRGRRMAEILETIAKTGGLETIDPLIWQKETRDDRSLPGR